LRNQPDYKIYLLHIFALSGFALVQPVLELLTNNTDFFVARGSQLIDLLALLLVLLFGLPLLMAFVYKVLEKISIHSMRIGHHIMVAILVGIIILPVLKKLDLADIWIMSIAVIARI